MYYVYILTNWCNEVMYIGVTNDLMRRVYEHKNKMIAGFTATYNVEKLVYYESFKSVVDAIKREKQLKKWSREKKNQLVERANSEWKELEL